MFAAFRTVRASRIPALAVLVAVLLALPAIAQDALIISEIVDGPFDATGGHPNYIEITNVGYC